MELPSEHLEQELAELNQLLITVIFLYVQKEYWSWMRWIIWNKNTGKIQNQETNWELKPKNMWMKRSNENTTSPSPHALRDAAVRSNHFEFTSCKWSVWMSQVLWIIRYTLWGAFHCFSCQQYVGNGAVGCKYWRRKRFFMCVCTQNRVCGHPAGYWQHCSSTLHAHTADIRQQILSFLILAGDG